MKVSKVAFAVATVISSVSAQAQTEELLGEVVVVANKDETIDSGLYSGGDAIDTGKQTITAEQASALSDGSYRHYRIIKNLAQCSDGLHSQSGHFCE